MNNKKQKILIIDLDFLPVRNANTNIVLRMLKLLDYKYNVVVACQNTKNVKDHEIINNIHIRRTEVHSLRKPYNNNLFDFFGLVFLKAKETIGANDFSYKNSFFFLRDLKNKINFKEISLIISFSSPFESHYCASIISKRYNIPWIAYYFDPFFSNYTLPPQNIERRRNIEEKILANASKVLLTYPTSKNYLGYNLSFKNKITNAEMPGIREELYCGEDFLHINKDKNKIDCYFIGNLYWSIRNPESTFRLFDSLPDNIYFHIVGGCFDKDIEQLNDSIKKYSNVIYHGVKTAEECREIIGQADILVNIGNSINNQMPSKIFEYISTGKPIINIHKIKDCPSLPYLSRYPYALNIYEPEIETNLQNISTQTCEFCFSNKDNRVPLKTIQKAFFGNTDDYVADALIKEIEKVLQSNV